MLKIIMFIIISHCMCISKIYSMLRCPPTKVRKFSNGEKEGVLPI